MELNTTLIYLTRTCKAICHQFPKAITQGQSAYSFEIVTNIKLHLANKRVNENKSRVQKLEVINVF